MTFFQNPFDQEFRGSFPLGDRQYSLTFAIGPNVNTSTDMICWNAGPYDLSTYNTLTINFAIDPTLKMFSSFGVNIAGTTPSATTAFEIVNKLNAAASFSDWFIAYTTTAPSDSEKLCVRIRAKREKQNIKVYITNAGAEQKLGFNKKAPIKELPSYYTRDTVANIHTYPDASGLLIALNEGDATVDQPLITAAGLDYSDMKADWELLAGRSGIFNFQKITVDGSNRITQIIEYPAGATAGYLGRKINYTYSGANTSPSQITEIPYVIASGDLITPP